MKYQKEYERYIGQKKDLDHDYQAADYTEFLEIALGVFNRTDGKIFPILRDMYDKMLAATGFWQSNVDENEQFIANIFDLLTSAEIKISRIYELEDKNGSPNQSE
jgi:hypothetical protein